jgi:hypothetical protein
MPRFERFSFTPWLMWEPIRLSSTPFRKPAFYVCEENERRLPKESLKAFEGAVDEFFAALKRPQQ